MAEGVRKGSKHAIFGAKFLWISMGFMDFSAKNDAGSAVVPLKVRVASTRSFRGGA
jgi:hypothetical protein